MMRGSGSGFLNRILFVVLLLMLKTIPAQTISPYFFGQNAWMPDTIGNASACPNPPCILYGKLHKQWAKIKSSSTAIVRFGGIAADRNKPTNFQYIKMIDSIRAKGMEPILQVPYHKNQYTAQQAAAIVQYVNITKGKNIKYWIIGNEPDLGYSYTTSAQIAAYFKPFASAMKAVDPTILTIGPECAWFNTTIINGLTTPNGPDDITGKDVNGNYYCDIISFHTYPFNGSQTRAQVITKLTAAGSFQDDLIYLNGRINNCNSAHNRTGSAALRTAVTEANVNYQNSSTDNLYGNGANSFIGGQFVAEMLGIGLKQNVNFINIWSVVEGNSTSLNIGYIDPPSGNRKPLYYHYKLMADNFKGSSVNTSDNQANVKTFASKDAINTVVMIMNQEQTVNLNFTVRLNTAAVTGTNPLKINVNANTAVEYNDVIANQTSIVLTFNQQGTLVKKCTYSLANHAAYNLPPTCETFNSTLPISLTFFSALPVNESVELTWQTASEINNDYFIVQRSADGLNFEDAGIIDGAGTSHGTINYSMTDEHPLKGISYYRLKQVDFDGSFSYSGLQVVSLYKKENTIVIYPNPSEGDSFNMGIANAEDINPRIKIYDLQGREIGHVLHRINSEGNTYFKVTPVAPLAKGVYMVVVSLGKEVYKNKLLVK